MKRFGFTLMEVNLAIVVMSLGVLGLVSLYSLGFRENRQSLEDVKSVAFAEQTMSQILAALGSKHVTWDRWMQISTEEDGGWPEAGWGHYAGTDANPDNPKPLHNPNSAARDVFNKALGIGGFSGDFNPDALDLKTGLVIVRKGSKCSVAMRCSNRVGSLLYQPLYYAEVQFQGLETQGGATP